MLRIYFDTSQYVSKERRTHDARVLDAKLVALNGVSYDYEKLTGPLINRLKFMLCLQSPIDEKSEGNRVKISYDYKDTVIKKSATAQLPGIPFIEDEEKEIRRIINAVMKNGKVKVPFSRYFDEGYANRLKGAYLVIENLDAGKVYRDNHFEYPGGK